MKPGDIVFTNFFGEQHTICLLLERKDPLPYGVDPCLVLLPDGRKAWFQSEALLTMDEYEGG